MGTLGSMMFGICSISWCSFSSYSTSNFSSSAKRSACALTLALMASASSSLLGSFLACPISMPTCLLSVLRCGAQLARLGDGGALLLVQLQYLVHEGELGVLKLLLNVFPHKFGVFTNKSNIQHDFLPRYHNIV